MGRKTGAALCLAIFGGVPALAASPFDAAKAFGAREDIMDVSIAPDGEHIAFVHSRGTRSQIVSVVTVATGVWKSILESTVDTDRIYGCRWSSAKRLICTTVLLTDRMSTAFVYSRMVALDFDGGNMKQLSARQTDRAYDTMAFGGNVIDLLGGNADGDDATVLMTRDVTREYTTGTMLGQTRDGVGVERINTLTLKRTMVEPPNGSASYITDGHGTVRIMGLQPTTTIGYAANHVTYSYRAPGNRQWRPLSVAVMNATGTDTGFEPRAVDRDLNVAYGFDAQNGRAAVFKIALDGSLKRELVYADPHVDVDGLIQIGRQNRVVGVSFATDKRQSVFFDPELKALGAALSRAMPGLPIVSFVDATADEKKLVLFAGSDNDPGRYFLYDKTTHKLGELVPERPQLEGVKLAKVTPVTFPAADGTLIPGYLTLPPDGATKGLPAIVMPHGGPAARDEWGFDWLAQYFANRGYAVLQPNYRGSTGYGNGWYEKNGFQSWRTAIGDVNASGHWLMAQGIAAPGKLAIFGWSYGGYAALQTSVLEPDLFKAIVAVAPVTDLEMLRSESENFMNGQMTDAFIGHGDHVRAGSPAQNVNMIKAPVLIFHGDRDRNVGIGESRMMAARLRSAGKTVDYVEYPMLDHQLADDAVRAQMLGRADGFLRKALGLGG